MNVSKNLENFTDYFYKNVATKPEGNYGCSAISAHLILSMAAYGAEEKTIDKIKQDLTIPEITEDDDSQALQEYQDEIDDTFSLYDTINNKTGGMLNRLFRVVNNVYLKVNTEEPPGELEDFYYYDSGKVDGNVPKKIDSET